MVEHSSGNTQEKERDKRNRWRCFLKIRGGDKTALMQRKAMIICDKNVLMQGKAMIIRREKSGIRGIGGGAS